jgi:hypothetical protein
MWLAPKDLQAPAALADKVVQVARAVDDNGLVEEAEEAEAVAVERFLVEAVVELEAAREVEARSAVEVAADFFASK